MSTNNPIKAGTWVELSRVVLESAQRPAHVPDDTRATDFILRVRGFLLDDAEVGGPARVRTLADRVIEGILADASPRFVHDFGSAVPELLQVGVEVRDELRRLSAGSKEGGRS